MPVRESVKEIFGYDKKGYLKSYRRFVLPSSVYAHEIRYSYSPNRRSITATYHDIAGCVNNSDYLKIVYHYNNRMQLINKRNSIMKGFEKNVIFDYNKSGLLINVKDDRTGQFNIEYEPMKEQSALQVRQEIFDNRLFDRAFDSVFATSAYKIVVRNGIDQGKIKYVQLGKGFVYSNFHDGDETGWRPPRHTGHPSPPAQFSGSCVVRAYRWGDGGGHLLNVMSALISSSYVGAKFFMDAKKDNNTGTWNIAINNENLRLDGRYDVEKKAKYINNALPPILNFSYDKVEYTYEYDFY